MSAWAVFTMLGLYPDCPGEPYYTLTSPVFDKVTIRLEPPSTEIDTPLVTQTSEKHDEVYIRRLLGAAAVEIPPHARRTAAGRYTDLRTQQRATLRLFTPNNRMKL